MSEKKDSKVIIIGSGPAGLTAAIYAARADLNPIVIAGYIWGGQLMNTTVVENFPGFPEGIEGPKLMENMIEQAKKFGAIIKFENAIHVDFKGSLKTVKTDTAEYSAPAVILATGSEPRKLAVPGEDKFYGRGVSTCATCDGAFYKDKVIAVIGGGDSAMEEATFLTRFAKKVFIIHRKEKFNASPIMAERAINNEKIEILYNTEIKEIIGEEVVKSIRTINNQTNKESILELDGVFLAIGHVPVTGYLNKELPLNNAGYVVPTTLGSMKTNIEGVFIAGEIYDYVYKQAITTSADGCKAALEAQRWLESKNM